MDIIVDDTGSGSLAPNVTVDDSNIADDNISLFGRGAIEVIFADGSGGGGSSVSSLKELLDVASTNLTTAANKYVLTYDAPQDRFVFVNPDDVIDSAVGISTVDPTPSGLSSGTLDYLDDYLDDKIDLDAGSF